MQVTFLGTGTSAGVPLIGCHCPTCLSADPRNKRNRSSVLVTWDGLNILIDTPPEFRLAAIKYGITSIDAVLYTHDHADHIFGFDDLRRFSQLSGKAVDLYAAGDTAKTIKHSFRYAFSEPKQIGGGIPQVRMHTIDKFFQLKGKEVIPLPARHGILPVLGFRFADLAYLTDVKTIPPDTLAKMHGLEMLILGVLRQTKHDTHMNLAEALELIEQIKPQKTLFTHLTHDFDHQTLAAELPFCVSPAYDGLRVEVGNEKNK